MDIEYRWRADLTDDELTALTRWYDGNAEPGWWDRVRGHSLGWMTARTTGGTLIGFANVAWDGGDHAFLLDPKVLPAQRHLGIGTELVRRATAEAARAGCSWLHVDLSRTCADFILHPAVFGRPTPD
jgi:GNAT superfamily N-acetyltransferase